MGPPQLCSVSVAVRMGKESVIIIVADITITVIIIVIVTVIDIIIVTSTTAALQHSSTAHRTSHHQRSKWQMASCVQSRNEVSAIISAVSGPEQQWQW